MPIISLTELAKIAAKLIVIAILAGIILTFIGSFVGIISIIFSKMSGISSSINGLNLGWFASAIGLVSFLNSLMVSFYVAISVLVSGMVTILGFKYGIQFYKLLMKF